MIRVVPSQAVEVIARLFPFVKTQKEGESQTLDFSYQEPLAAIIHLIDQIPSELITLKDLEYIEFLMNLEALRSTLKSFEQRGNVSSVNF